MDEQAVRAAVDRICASDQMIRARRMQQLLRFLVERVLSGEETKEYSIGVEVFGRPSSFDPRMDPIVRVEAVRLRHKLGEYYRGPGRHDTLVVSLKRGGYRPSFEERKRRTPKTSSSLFEQMTELCERHHHLYEQLQALKNQVHAAVEQLGAGREDTERNAPDVTARRKPPGEATAPENKSDLTETGNSSSTTQ